MAVDLSAESGPALIKDIELSGALATAVSLPSWAYVCYLQFTTAADPAALADGSFAFTGTDGGAVVDERFQVGEGVTFPIPVGAAFPSGSRTIYLAGNALPPPVARIIVVARNMGA